MPNCQSMARDVFQVLGTRVEYEQLLRNFYVAFWSLWMVTGPFMIFLSFSRPWIATLWFLAFAALMLLVAGSPFFRSELVLDQERQELMLRNRRFFFFRSYTPLVGAEELWCTTYAGELPQAPFTWWWQYVTLILTRNGQRFRAFKVDKDSTLASRRARELAQQLGIEYQAGEDERRLTIEPGPVLQFRKLPAATLDAVALIYWGLFIMPSGAFLFYGGMLALGLSASL